MRGLACSRGPAEAAFEISLVKRCGLQTFRRWRQPPQILRRPRLWEAMPPGLLHEIIRPVVGVELVLGNQALRSGGITRLQPPEHSRPRRRQDIQKGFARELAGSAIRISASLLAAVRPKIYCRRPCSITPSRKSPARDKAKPVRALQYRQRRSLTSTEPIKEAEETSRKRPGQAGLQPGGARVHARGPSTIKSIRHSNLGLAARDLPWSFRAIERDSRQGRLAE